MRRIYTLIIPFLFAFNNAFCQDTISIRLSVNDVYQTIVRRPTIKILIGKQRISSHFVNDSILVIDKFINNSGKEVRVELCANSYFMKINNFPTYVIKSGKWNIDFDYYPFSSENEIEARSDIDNTKNVIVVLGYKSKKPNTEGMEFLIFQRKKDVKCRSCNWLRGLGVR